MKKKGRGKGRGKGRRKGRGKGRRRKGKGEREEKEKRIRVRGGKNMRGKEMKKMDKGTNVKELRNFGISLIIHDRRLSGVYILK